LRFEGN